MSSKQLKYQVVTGWDKGSEVKKRILMDMFTTRGERTAFSDFTRTINQYWDSKDYPKGIANHVIAVNGRLAIARALHNGSRLQLHDGDEIYSHQINSLTIFPQPEEILEFFEKHAHTPRYGIPGSDLEAPCFVNIDDFLESDDYVDLCQRHEGWLLLQEDGYSNYDLGFISEESEHIDGEFNGVYDPMYRCAFLGRNIEEFIRFIAIEDEENTTETLVGSDIHELEQTIQEFRKETNAKLIEKDKVIADLKLRNEDLTDDFNRYSRDIAQQCLTIAEKETIISEQKKVIESLEFSMKTASEAMEELEKELKDAFQQSAEWKDKLDKALLQYMVRDPREQTEAMNRSFSDMTEAEKAFFLKENIGSLILIECEGGKECSEIVREVGWDCMGLRLNQKRFSSFHVQDVKAFGMIDTMAKEAMVLKEGETYFDPKSNVVVGRDLKNWSKESIESLFTSLVGQFVHLTMGIDGRTLMGRVEGFDGDGDLKLKDTPGSPRTPYIARLLVVGTGAPINTKNIQGPYTVPIAPGPQQTCNTPDSVEDLLIGMANSLGGSTWVMDLNESTINEKLYVLNDLTNKKTKLIPKAYLVFSEADGGLGTMTTSGTSHPGQNAIVKASDIRFTNSGERSSVIFDNHRSVSVIVQQSRRTLKITRTQFKQPSEIDALKPLRELRAIIIHNDLGQTVDYSCHHLGGMGPFVMSFNEHNVDKAVERLEPYIGQEAKLTIRTSTGTKKRKAHCRKTPPSDTIQRSNHYCRRCSGDCSFVFRHHHPTQ